MLTRDHDYEAFGYTVDPAGNREDMTKILAGTQHFVDWTYDDLYRLTAEVRKLNDAQGAVVAEQHFTYDGVGNRQTHVASNILGDAASWSDTYSYNAANQLTQVARAGGPTTTFGYDEAGNQISKADSAATWGYGFDYRNRMRSFDGPGTENDTTYAFYPHHWARRSRDVAGQVTKFVYDGDNVVAEYDGAGANTVTYLTPFLDQNVAMTIPAGRPDAGTYFYLQDGLGSVRNLLDAAQAAKNVHDYEAFGGTLSTYSPQIANPAACAGRRSDVESGMMHYRNRQYDAGLGAFRGRDPLVGVYGVWLVRSGWPVALPRQASAGRPAPGPCSLTLVAGPEMALALVVYRPCHVRANGHPYTYGGNSPTGTTDPMGTWFSCNCCEKMRDDMERQGFMAAMKAKGCIRGIHCTNAASGAESVFDVHSKSITITCPSDTRPDGLMRHELTHAAAACGLCGTAFGGLNELEQTVAEEYSAYRAGQGQSPAQAQQSAAESTGFAGIAPMDEVRAAVNRLGGDLERRYGQCLSEAKTRLEQ